jgi:hypothetical protein
MSDDNRAIVLVGQHGVVASVNRQIAITEKVLGSIKQKTVGSTMRSELKATELTMNDPEAEACVWVEQFLEINTNLDFKELQTEVLSHEKDKLRNILPDADDALLNRLVDSLWYRYSYQDDIRWKHFKVEEKQLWSIFHYEWTEDCGNANYVKSKWLLREKELIRHIGK